MVFKKLRDIVAAVLEKPIISCQVTRECLFLGGPLDGVKKCLPVSQTRYHCDGVNKDVYVLEWLGFEGRVYSPVFVHSKEHLTDILDDVIDACHYHEMF